MLLRQHALVIVNKGSMFEECFCDVCGLLTPATMCRERGVGHE